MDLSQEQRDECMEIRRNSRDKQKHDDSNDNYYTAKITALELKLEEQAQQISSLLSASCNVRYVLIYTYFIIWSIHHIIYIGLSVSSINILNTAYRFK